MKELAVSQKKLEKIKHKKVVIITVVVRDLKDVKKTVPNVLKKAIRKVLNPYKKVVVRATKLIIIVSSQKRSALTVT